MNQLFAIILIGCLLKAHLDNRYNEVNLRKDAEKVCQNEITNKDYCILGEMLVQCEKKSLHLNVCKKLRE